MRKLTQCDLWLNGEEDVKRQQNVIGKISTAIHNNIEGIEISPELLSIPLTQLYYNKNAADSLIIGAIDNFKKHSVRIFNSSSYSDLNLIQPIIFIVDTTNNSIDMNATRMGNWDDDNTRYNNLEPLTDLKTLIVSGYVTQKILKEGYLEKVLDNKALMYPIIRAYTDMFRTAFGSMSVLFTTDMEQAEAYYAIGKFFCLHSLELSENEADSYAINASNISYGKEYLHEFEEINNITYDSLSSFINSISTTFAKKTLNLTDFVDKFILMFGTSTLFAIEYFPYLLHVLLAVHFSSSLGNGNKLISKRAIQLKKPTEIPKFYQQLVVTLK
jgi:hypothetical protein